MKLRQIAIIAATVCIAAHVPPAPAPAAEVPAAAPSAASVSTPALEQVTGVVVDLGNKTMEPAMSVRIVDENGQTVYGDFTALSPEATSAIIDQGTASFATTWAEAKARAGNTPLIVKGIAVDGSDIRIPLAAAQQIREADQHKGFLEALKVAVISSGTPENEGEPAVVAVGDTYAVRPMPAWKKFRPNAPANQKALLARFKARHPRLATLLAAMQTLTPAERKLVRDNFPFGANARQMTPQQRQAQRRAFQQKYPQIALKLKGFFQEAQERQRPMRRHR